MSAHKLPHHHPRDYKSLDTCSLRQQNDRRFDDHTMNSLAISHQLVGLQSIPAYFRRNLLLKYSSLRQRKDSWLLQLSPKSISWTGIAKWNGFPGEGSASTSKFGLQLFSGVEYMEDKRQNVTSHESVGCVEAHAPFEQSDGVAIALKIMQAIRTTVRIIAIVPNNKLRVTNYQIVPTDQCIMHKHTKPSTKRRLAVRNNKKRLAVWHFFPSSSIYWSTLRS